MSAAGLASLRLQEGALRMTSFNRVSKNGLRPPAEMATRP